MTAQMRADSGRAGAIERANKEYCIRKLADHFKVSTALFIGR